MKKANMILRKIYFVVLFLLAHFEYISGLSPVINNKRSVDNVQQFTVEKLRSTRDVQGKSHFIEKRSADTSSCDKFKSTINQNDDKFRSAFAREAHMNESSNMIQLTWTGENYERIVALTTSDTHSVLYVSNAFNDGNMFQNISDRLKGKLDGNIFMIKHPRDPQLLILLSNGNAATSKSTLFISTDGSDNFKTVELDFEMSASDGLLAHRNDSRLMTAFDSDKSLYLTKDKGFTWKKIASNVIDAKWSQNDEKPDDIFATVNNASKGIPTEALSGDTRFETSLMRSENFGEDWKEVKNRIFKFGMEGEFIYVSTYLYPTDDKVLEVSTDNGNFWNYARLPTIKSDMFFTIMDLSQGVIFLHVDESGDTGKGTLYTSDATGIIFSMSLDDHLYPNFEDTTDFYAVRSMPGVYISNQLARDNSIVTMISYNRGGEWQKIKRPTGAGCHDEKLPCHLQIHNSYSVKRGVMSKSPLSVPNAKGVILVHGNIADSLQMSKPDVYVSSDGGHNWNFALKGPHHYQIADHGGLLVAVPADTATPNTIKFSANSGRCWVEYKFTDEEITFTGLVTEPNNTGSVVALWGYSNISVWHTFVFNFTQAVPNKCEKDDYEEWKPQSHNDEGCFLGRTENNYRIKETSWCLTGRVNPHNVTAKNCICTRNDYSCDYGYKKDGEDCIKDATIKEMINICLRNHQEQLVPLGYHKIPGDTCVGGFAPEEAKMINLDIVCTGDVYQKKDAIMDDELEKKMKEFERARAHKIAWTIVLIIVAVVIIASLVLAGKRLNNKYRNVTFKYSTIRSNEDDYFDVSVGGHNKPLSTSLYDDLSDEDNPEQPLKTAQNSNGVANDELRSGFIHPKLFNLVNSNPSPLSQVPLNDELLTLYDSDDELLK